MRNFEWLTRGIRPPDDVTPNTNLAGDPDTVGTLEQINPGDPAGVELVGDAAPWVSLPSLLPSPWSGWPADWWTPNWTNGHRGRLTDTAWTCVDLNASILMSMRPFLVDAAPNLDCGWLTNPNPEIYSSWEEFAKQLFWDFQLGEVFVIVAARYRTGWPARFHVVPPWMVKAEMVRGRRRYTVAEKDVTEDICHIRYQSSTDDAHGHGPLEAGGARLTAADLLTRYVTNFTAAGGVPSSILTHPDELSAERAAELRAQWIQARLEGIGAPAVLSGGVTWEATQVNPKDMALLELQEFNESRIAIMLGVPPFLVGLPAGGDSMTYSNVTSLFDFHWRAGLRPKAAAVGAALSEFLLPRGTALEFNADAYVRPEPLARAQTAEIYNRIQDAEGNAVMTVKEIREAERLNDMTPIGGPI